MLGIFRKQDTFLPYAEVKSLSEAYEVAVRNVINQHEEVVTEDGEVTWQSNPFTICITQPWRTNFIHKFSPYGREFYKKYADDIVNGTSNKFVYTYHDRLFHYRKHYYDDLINEFIPSDVYGLILDEYIDQINYVVDKLVYEPTSRRAIAITISPYIDEVKKDIPCLQEIQFWISEGKLNIYVFMRSNDILLGMPQNIRGFYKLQFEVAKRIGIHCGKLFYTVTIPHAYINRDKNELSKWL